MKIYYTTIELPTGVAYAAATDKGITRLELRAASKKKFLSELEAEFGQAPVEDNKPFKTLARELELYFTGRLTRFSVPLDVRGTDFQMKVWKALLKVPSGSVRSYKQLAGTVGNPAGARAVGGAVGSNRVPIVIPCHRIIESSGGLGGYGGGLDIKKKLLEVEGAPQKAVSSRGPAARPRKAQSRPRSKG